MPATWEAWLEQPQMYFIAATIEDVKRQKALTLRRATSEPSMVGIGGGTYVPPLEILGLVSPLDSKFGPVTDLHEG